jgi:hypothetical protein
MAHCETCGNDYDRTITVTRAGVSHTYDSFECAIHALAPICERRGIRILGHGVETSDHIYCSANCARGAGTAELVDHFDPEGP